MIVTGISGSPRMGATGFVLSKALEYLEGLGIEIRLLTVRGRRINFCIHCDHCLKASTPQHPMSTLRQRPTR